METQRPGARPSSLVGTVVGGRYRVTRTLAESGTDVLVEAVRDDIGQIVAVKMLKPSGRTPAVERRFQREIKATASLQHPNVVSIFDSGGPPEDPPFYAMEFVHSRLLTDLVIRQAPIDARRAFGIVRQICAGIGAAHARGIFHRNLSPQSVFIGQRDSRAEFATVGDFGMVKLADDPSQSERAGVLFGTHGYMAPELADPVALHVKGPAPEAQTDVYAIGCIAFEMLAGRVPNLDQSALRTLRRRRHAAPDWPAEAANGVPSAFREVIDTMLESEPQRRPASGLEALRLLDTLDPRSMDVAPPNQRRPTRRSQKVARAAKSTGRRTPVRPATLDAPPPKLRAETPPLVAQSRTLGRGMVLLGRGETAIALVHSANEHMVAATCYIDPARLSVGDIVTLSFPKPLAMGGAVQLEGTVTELEGAGRAARLALRLESRSQTAEYTALRERWYAR